MIDTTSSPIVDNKTIPPTFFYDSESQEDHQSMKRVHSDSSLEENKSKSLHEDTKESNDNICKGCNKYYSNIRLHLKKSKDKLNCEKEYTDEELKIISDRNSS